MATDVPDLSSDESEGYNENDIEEKTDAKCLFCSDCVIISESLIHLKEKHNFDISYLRAKFNMDCYDYIKLINYIRTNKIEASEVMQLSDRVWNDDRFLKPVLEDDTFLMIDFDEIEAGVLPPPASANGKGEAKGDAENHSIIMQQVDELQDTVKELMNQLQERDACLERMAQDMQNMREVAKKIIGADDVNLQQDSVKSVSAEADDSYFQTYAHFDIHHQMLSDRVRTESYRDAIMMNKSVIEKKTVLDLGCGTGILSMFAASGGAAKVMGIDQSEIIYSAMDIIRENGMDKNITLIKGRLEDTVLPLDKVDVIISEWMGYFLLYEAMLDSVIYAREHHLSKGGLLLPNRCTANLVGIEDNDRHRQLIHFWEDVYGFRMTCMQSEVLREPSVEVVPKDKIVTSSFVLTEIDLYSCSTDCINYTSEFSLEALRDCTITSFAGYFDVFFDLPVPIQFSTGPVSEATHWKQTVFFLKQPIPLQKGETLTGKLTCMRKEVRSLAVTISLLGQVHKFTLS
ncbi:protein arginine N-methyltransferase 1 [Schistocerca cancellata]|uniref:protein arginine N-methyltransferase 1 n=1 Tax=Schistocerca cancellata TaxID=274614 RepID=UPI0021176AA2|nr:protein arginine N-methyltransferase 1 [Schistocerca cancellata]